MIRILFFLLISLSCSFAKGRKGPKTTISFHLENVGGMETKKFTFEQMTAGKIVTYRNIPIISFKDVVAYNPFPADDQNTYGLVLQLSNVAKGRLTHLSTENQGRWLLSQVNGRVVDAVRIDQPVTDGQIVIWKNISSAELRLLDKSIPRIGEDKKTWKKRVKENRKKS